MNVTVTGAAGRLGSVVCQALKARGHQVRATDVKAGPAASSIEIADLRNEADAQRVVAGNDAVVHLANHPNLIAGPSPQRLLAENVAMNAHVFRAAVEGGVRRIVFASSIQAMLRLDGGRHPRNPARSLPYLPLDGAAPANPGDNFYGLSKEFGERMLQVLAGHDPKLAATALRFPMLIEADWLEPEQHARSNLNFDEALTYLLLSDAARLVSHVVERQAPGYHQYFPAQALSVAGVTVAELRERFFQGVPLRGGERLAALVDLGALERDLGFSPEPAVTVEWQLPSAFPRS